MKESYSVGKIREILEELRQFPRKKMPTYKINKTDSFKIIETDKNLFIVLLDILSSKDSEKLREIREIFLEYVEKYDPEKTSFVICEESLMESGIFTEKVLGLDLKEFVTYKLFDTAFSKRKIFHQTSVFDTTLGIFAYEAGLHYKNFKKVMKRFGNINLPLIEKSLYLKYFVSDYVFFNILKNLEYFDEWDVSMFFISKAKKQFVVEMRRQIKRYEAGETYISETFSYAERFFDLLSESFEGLSNEEKEIVLKYADKFESRKTKEFRNGEFCRFLKGNSSVRFMKKELSGVTGKEYLKLYGKYRDLLKETDTGFEMNEERYDVKIEPSEFLTALKIFTFEKALRKIFPL